MAVFDETHAGDMLADPRHRAFLADQARALLDFFRPSLRADGGFDVLALDGTALPREPQELHTTTRLIHSYAMAQAAGYADAAPIIDAGMDFLWNAHRDTQHGGYLWSVGADGPADDIKLAYGHVFVLLAASSAKQVGHPDADRLLTDISQILTNRYWEAGPGLFSDEYRRDWSPFSSYRGMNANMHGVEALLAAFEATGDAEYLARAGSILDFFVYRIAPDHGWRLPEHYDATWQVDPGYAGNPMFRPAGSTPGHSFELGRLTLQHWDLAGRQGNAPDAARHLIERAHDDAWAANGGYAYTLDKTGQVDIPDRYWWPVTEAIGAYAALMKLGGTAQDQQRYAMLWQFADRALIDHDRGGWFPELDAEGHPTDRQFAGKPDIYHALQACLLPITPGLSRWFDNTSPELV